MTSIDQNNNFIDTEDDKSCDKDEDTQQEQPQETDDLSDAGGEIVREKGLPFLLVLLNFFKGLVGAGFLTLPLAFRHAGAWSGLFLLIFIAFLSYYAMSHLVACAQYHYTRLKIPFLNYGDVAGETCKASFQIVQKHGNLAKSIVNTAIIVHQFGTCSMYYLFIATNLRDIIAYILGGVAGEWCRNWPWWLMIFPVMVLLNSVLSMHILSIICIIGNALLLSSLALTLYILFGSPGLRIDEVPTALTIHGLFLAIGTVIVSCLAQSLVLPLENKLKRPRQMLGPFGILSCGIILSVLIYACVGFFGFLAFDKVTDSILKELPNDILTMLIRLALSLSILASFLLQMFVIVDVLWPRIDRMIKLSPVLKMFCQLLFRALMVSICFLISYSVKDLSRIVSLIGVTTGTLLAFVFPAMIDLLTFVPLFLEQNQIREAYVRIGQSILLACIGLTIMAGGLTANIVNLVNSSGVSPNSTFCIK
uniref:Amino acid transporter transmembrane domain-containing protein n=1 Tax=Globodera rostochiensis TaxID=31243 RepID=A0A914H2P3_GLORO